MSYRIAFTKPRTPLSRVAMLYLASLQGGNTLTNESKALNEEAVEQLIHQKLCKMEQYKIKHKDCTRTCVRLVLTNEGKGYDLLTTLSIGEPDTEKNGPKKPVNNRSLQKARTYLADNLSNPETVLYQKRNNKGFRLLGCETVDYLPAYMGKKLIKEYNLISKPMELLDKQYKGNTMFITLEQQKNQEL